MKKRKNKGAQEVITDAARNVVTASLRTRQHPGGSHVTDGTPIRLSKGDWRRVIVGALRSFAGKHLVTLSAGVAFYSALAFFPFLAAGAAIAALVISPEQLEALVSTTDAYLPNDISRVVEVQMQNLMSGRIDNSIAAAVALAVALFGASGASKNLVVASNVAYGVKESRGWIAQQLWGIIWTVFGLSFGVFTLFLLAINQSVLSFVGIPEEIAPLLLGVRWLVLLLVSISCLAIFYRYGPNRPHVRWQWVSWGAVIATIAWLATTSLFFAYVQSFANFTQSYSLFAGAIMLMIWLNLSAIIVLLGAEVNHQLEVVGHKRWGGFLHHS